MNLPGDCADEEITRTVLLYNNICKYGIKRKKCNTFHGTPDFHVLFDFWNSTSNVHTTWRFTHGIPLVEESPRGIPRTKWNSKLHMEFPSCTICHGIPFVMEFQMGNSVFQIPLYSVC